MGRHDGGRGLVEANALRAICAGRKYDEKSMGQWRRGLGRPRQDNHTQNSQNIWPVCHATGYELGEEDGSKLERWANDQLCLNPAGSEWNTGGDGLEAGTNHYGTFPRGAIARVIATADKRGDDSLADAMRHWLLPAMDWFDTARCLPVGMRCQGHFEEVAVDLLKVGRGMKLPTKRLAQTQRWPVAVMNAGWKPLTWAGAVESWRVRVAFEIRIYRNAIWMAMLRKRGDIWNDNGSPSYAAYRVDGQPTVKLEFDISRNPSPSTVEVGDDGGWRVAVATHETGGDSHELRLDLALAGPLVQALFIPVLGPMRLDG